MLILLLVCLGTPGLQPQGDGVQMREEVHRELGLALRVPQEYKPITVRPAEPWIVLRYADGWLERFSVFRFDRPLAQADEQIQPAPAFEDYLARGEKEGFWKIHERVEGRPREGWTTREYALVRGEKKLFLDSAWAYELRSAERTWGLLGFRGVLSPHGRHSLWRTCAEEMELFEPETTPSPERKHWRKHYKFRPQLRNPEYRMAVRSRLGDGWAVADTENFLFVDNTKEGFLMRHLQKKLEGIRKIYAERFPPTDEITAVATVRICKDEGEYLQYGGERGTAGFWSPLREELVLYEAGREDSLRTLYHEGFHQYVHHAIGELQPHSWYNEGYGDYFGGARFTEEGVITQIQANPQRLPVIQEASREATHASWSDMIRMERSDYYGPKIAIHYAMGWSMIYFLEEAEVVAKHPIWSQILPVYFDALKESAVREKDWLPATLGILSVEADEAPRAPRVSHRRVACGTRAIPPRFGSHREFHAQPSYPRRGPFPPGPLLGPLRARPLGVRAQARSRRTVPTARLAHPVLPRAPVRLSRRGPDRRRSRRRHRLLFPRAQLRRAPLDARGARSHARPARHRSRQRPARRA